MEKHVIKVPKGIRYIGDWEGFYDEFPNCPHIMDKTITGCGFTEWCLTNNFNVILCSPRNILLENKAEQHPGEVYRIKSEFFDKELGVDKDTTILSKTVEPVEKDISEEEFISESAKLVTRIDKELDEYFAARNIKPKKILVTYDSFHVVKDVLKSRGILSAFYIIVDEFQSVFTDARFKSNTEMEFVNTLQGIQKVCYLSATPMMDEYLKDIPEFANLPYYKLDWNSGDPSRVTKPDLLVRVVKSIYEPAKKIIENFKTGIFPKTSPEIQDDGNIVIKESHEAIFYVNSVNNICQIIKKTGLFPEETNLLCANTEKNRNYVKNKLGEGWKIGKVPLRNEPRKMFTFCTRTVYLGADFYSDNASSYILSDANVDCLAVDISLDLPQILGRQRLEENPWKNKAEFYYKPITDKNKAKMTKEEFDAKIADKKKTTEDKLKMYQKSNAEERKLLLNDWADLIKFKNYNDDYIGINKRGGNGMFPETNNLVLIAERRAFDIQQIDYADRFVVLKTIYGSGNYELNEDNAKLSLIVSEYDSIPTMWEKLKFLCESDIEDKFRNIIINNHVDEKMRYILSNLEPNRLKALGYRITGINKELDILMSDKSTIKDLIYQNFKVGDKVSNLDAKNKLKEIYIESNYEKTPKANDLEEWFEVRPCQFKLNDKKVNGLEILNQKL